MKCLYYIIGIVVLLAISTKASEEEVEEVYNDAISEDDGGDEIVAETPAQSAHLDDDMEALTPDVEANLAKQPGAVVRYFRLWLDSGRHLRIQRVSEETLKLQGKLLNKIYIGKGTRSRTSTFLAYRPRYVSFHRGSKLGAIFVNLNRLYPCSKVQPLCRSLTFEEDGFLRGKAIIEAADSGNNMKIFSTKTRTRTYGQVFQGCSTLTGNGGCLPKWHEQVIACHLPRACQNV